MHFELVLRIESLLVSFHIVCHWNMLSKLCSRWFCVTDRACRSSLSNEILTLRYDAFVPQAIEHIERLFLENKILNTHVFPIEICNHISVNIKIVVYWPIYDIEYWPIYEIFQKSFFDRYMSKFSFFDRYMKIFIFFKITIFGFYSLVGFIKTSYIGHYKNAYIGLYKNVYKTLGDLAYIDLYTPYRFAA